MVEPPLIDRSSIDLAGAEPGWRADLWADAVRPLYDVSLLGGKPEDHLSRGTVWLLDTLVLINASFGSQLVHRHQRHLKADVANTVLLEIYLSGEVQRDLDGEWINVRPGDVHLMDYSREYRGRSKSAEVINLQISHEQIGYDPSRHPAAMRFPADSALGHILGNTVRNTFDELDSVTKTEAPAIARSLTTLVRSVLTEDAGTAPCAATFDSARSQAIRDHIRRNLRTGELNVDSVCARFNISRATLFRDMKEDGGLDRYVMAQRLEAALMWLASGPAARGAVTRAAEHWGFSSTTHFSREFRRRFGFAPSDVVQNRPYGEYDAPRLPAALHDRRLDILPFLKRL